MKKVIYILSCISFLACNVQTASNVQEQKQERLTIRINPKFGLDDFQLNTSYSLSNQDSVRFEMLKFYISNIRLYDEEKLVWKMENSFHLVDYENIQSMTIACDVPTNLMYNQLKMDIGIDSATNVCGAMGGDLDPTLGMYWTWQSGYIHLKLEGSSSLCKSFKNEFQYHIGGYQPPYAALQPLAFSVERHTNINIKADIKAWLDKINLAEQNSIMSPGAESVALAKWLPLMFEVQR
jgi:hypothetical protein